MIITHIFFNNAKLAVFIVSSWLLISFAPVRLIAQERCMTSHYRQNQFHRNPGYLDREQEINRKINQLIIEKGPSRSEIRSQVIIPVVIHIVWADSSENLSDQVIKSQIDALNADFRLQNLDRNNLPASFDLIPADCGIEFCLAHIAPDSTSTTGITRTKTTSSCIGMDMAEDGRMSIHHTDLGGKDAWNPEEYLNIWVGSMCGPLGRSSYPAQSGEPEDGVVIDPACFGTLGKSPPWNLGRTTTHEIGHYLNLQHIWGESTTMCEDDEVEDTPLQRSFYLGCPNHPQLSCGSEDLFMNYMNYTDDACMMHFTEGQKQRMRMTLFNFRNGLLNHSKCNDYIPVDSVVGTPSLTFSIFPNPSEGYFTLAATNPATELVRIDVFSSAGRLLHSENRYLYEKRPIDGSNWPTGFYVIRITCDTRQSRQKLLIIH